MVAARAGDLETVQLLVGAGAKIKILDWSYKTPLLYAAEGGHKEIMIYLGQTQKIQYKVSAW